MVRGRSKKGNSIMIHKTKSTVPGHVRIVFELPSSVWAHRISVLGEFNNWKEQADLLTQDRDGQWRTALDLPADREYEFCYLVDGQKLIDVRADGLSQGKFSDQKSIVVTTLNSDLSSEESVGHRKLYTLQ